MGPARQLRQQVISGECSAEEILNQTLEAVTRHNSRLHAFLRIDEAQARQQARQIDDRRGRGAALGLLAGVPIAIKDNICTRWGLTTCGSRILADYRSPFDAHVIERLLAADAVLVGKTNLDEFAMGSSTENSAFGPSRNPWNPDYVPGGSSGGSAAAVSAGLVPLALGSETGGSVRQPASFCNLTGLKPSYGRVSRYGLVAFGSSLDQIGPFATDVADLALLLQVIAGRDSRDSTSVELPVPDYVAELEQPLDRLRIGVAAEYFGDGLDSQVRNAVEQAIREYEKWGAEIVEVSIPHLRYAIACYYLVCTAEASSNLARFDGVHYGHRTAERGDIIQLYSRSRAEGFGAEVKRRIMLGTYALSSGYYDAYYLKTLKVRRLLKEDFDRAFARVDVLISPTSPVPPFRFGERLADPLAMYLADIYTAATNLAGICGISIPCGFTSQGLPIGLQLQAAAFNEARLLRIARAYQQHTSHHTRRPELPR
ncbi:MAG: Glutamyl-tRNA(Gln) amidotransferase subunit A [Phycisphaerae bacterium]|nr:Glutamyl-tRNA(Gln) amidotransferase subunit A [Phycisphaerae bacterium]